MVLEDAGYEVETLTDGRRTLEVAQRTGPDLVVLDWVMGESEGDKVTRQLRNDSATARIPVLLISATHDGEITARTYGIDGFLRNRLMPRHY